MVVSERPMYTSASSVMLGSAGFATGDEEMMALVDQTDHRKDIRFSHQSVRRPATYIAAMAKIT